MNFALTDGTVLFALRLAYMNDEKYPMNFANLDSLGLVGGEKVLHYRGSTTATVVSSEPFTSGNWSSLEMGEMLVATAAGHRVVKV